MNNPWISATVLRGDQTGRTIDFPSLNLDASLWPEALQAQPGVYASRVRIAGKTYSGALYYGPRLVKKEVHNVLEIHVLDFAEEIYDQTIEFQVGAFVRPPLDFISLAGLREQLAKDVEEVREELLNQPT
ncbi:MAG: riboflavin kinase [bacterium]|nr:riboflavin kinase [bacterium]